MSAKEVWKEIKGYEGLYLISTQGRVKSLQRKHPVILKQCYSAGYAGVSLCRDTKIRVLTHRLVAEAFISNTHLKPCVNHINGIKDDNRVENLEWCTYKENTAHGQNTGLIRKRPAAKLGVEDIQTIRRLYETKTQTEIASIYSISQSTVSVIVTRKQWKDL